MDVDSHEDVKDALDVFVVMAQAAVRCVYNHASATVFAVSFFIAGKILIKSLFVHENKKIPEVRTAGDIPV